MTPSASSELISLGEGALNRIRSGLASTEEGNWVSFDQATILAPIPRPARNILCVGKNYSEHAEEFHQSSFDSTGTSSIPEFPIIFTKAITSVVGPGDSVRASDDETNSVDYEAELAVVIGKGGYRIAPEDVWNHVYGYTIVNDVTSRILQRRHNQWFLGKGMDTFCPMGPVIVTADEIGDIGELEVTMHVNGELRQSAKVVDLLFDVPTLICEISKRITLVSGDIIATGTPSGVGVGFNPPKYLKPGDMTVVEISGIGVLENPIA